MTLATHTYALFAYDSYYPGGGLGDLVSIFTAESDEAAITRAQADRSALEARPGGHHDYWDLAELLPDTDDGYRDVYGEGWKA